MDKPGKTKREAYDYNDVIDYIEKKYNVDTRDYANKWKHMDKWIATTGNKRPSCPNANSPDYKEGLEKYYEDCRKYAKWCEENPEPPYLDFWHWVIDECDYIRNGCYFTLQIKRDEGEVEGWIKEILDMIYAEYGLDEMEFWVSW